MCLTESPPVCLRTMKHDTPRAEGAECQWEECIAGLLLFGSGMSGSLTAGDASSAD